MAGDMPDMKALLALVAGGKSLSEAEAEAAFDIMMSGNATPAQMGGFLMALRVRGEMVEEITGAARTMRAKALRIAAPRGAIDTVGTCTYRMRTVFPSSVSAFEIPNAYASVRAPHRSVATPRTRVPRDEVDAKRSVGGVSVTGAIVPVPIMTPLPERPRSPFRRWLGSCMAW